MDFKLEDYKKSEVLALIFLKLSFKDWKEKVSKMNEAVTSSGNKLRPFSEKEFLTGLGMLIGAAEFAKRSCDLFGVRDQKEEDDDDAWTSLCPQPHFEMFMPFGRFKDIRACFPCIYADHELEDKDPWYMFCSAVDEFNDIRRRILLDSKWITADESMSAWRPRKTA